MNRGDLYGNWGLDIRTAEIEVPGAIHRTIGWSLPYVWRDGETAAGLAKRLTVDPRAAANDILGSIEDNYQGLGHHWTRNSDVAHRIADVYNDRDHPEHHQFQVIFSGTHSPEDVDTQDAADSMGGDWPDEEETLLRPGSAVNVHRVKIRPAGSTNWTTVPMDRDAFTSWGRTSSRHLAGPKKWHGFCNWCDWNAGPVPWVELQKQRLQHAYDTGGDPTSPEGQGGHISVVSEVPHPLSPVDKKRYPVTYVPFRKGDEIAKAVRARNSGVAVMHNGDHIGQVEWYPEDHPSRGSEVSWIDVDPEYRRHGIATSLFDWAKEKVNPNLHHSDYQTAEGEQWVNHSG